MRRTIAALAATLMMVLATPLPAYGADAEPPGSSVGDIGPESPTDATELEDTGPEATTDPPQLEDTGAEATPDSTELQDTGAEATPDSPQLEAPPGATEPEVSEEAPPPETASQDHGSDASETFSAAADADGELGSIGGTFNDDGAAPMAGTAQLIGGPTVRWLPVTDGAFTFTDVEAGDYRVCAYWMDPIGHVFPSCFGGGDSSGTLNITVMPGEAVTGIDIEATRVRISGVVTDDRGDPVSAATVTLRRKTSADGAWPSSAYRTFTTGPAGTYQFNDLHGGYWYAVCATASGHVDQCWHNKPTLAEANTIRSVSGADRPGINLTLVRMATISGTVKTVAGDPVPGSVTIRPVGTGGGHSVITGTDGAWESRGLSPGAYTVCVAPSETHAPECWQDQPDVASATPVHLGGTSVTGIHIEVGPGGSIAGTVTADANFGSVGVTLYRLVGGAWRAAAYAEVFGSGDAYELELLAPGTYRACIADDPIEDDSGDSDPRFVVPACWADASSLNTATDIGLGPGEAVTGIDIHLALRPGPPEWVSNLGFVTNTTDFFQGIRHLVVEFGDASAGATVALVAVETDPVGGVPPATHPFDCGWTDGALRCDAALPPLCTESIASTGTCRGDESYALDVGIDRVYCCLDAVHFQPSRWDEGVYFASQDYDDGGTHQIDFDWAAGDAEWECQDVNESHCFEAGYDYAWLQNFSLDSSNVTFDVAAEGDDAITVNVAAPQRPGGAYGVELQVSYHLVGEEPTIVPLVCEAACEPLILEGLSEGSYQFQLQAVSLQSDAGDSGYPSGVYRRRDHAPVTVGPPVVDLPVVDLVVAKAASSDRVFTGGEVTWTVDVTNNGLDDATGVTLTDDLPAGLTYVSDSGCDIAGGVWDIGDLAPEETLSCDITTTVTTAGNHTNTVTAAGADTDHDLDNNAAQATITATDPVVCCDVTGAVTDDDTGEPVAGVTVALDDGSSARVTRLVPMLTLTIGEILTGADGLFAFARVSPGDFRLIVTDRSGRYPAETIVPFTVTGDGDVDVPVRLRAITQSPVPEAPPVVEPPSTDPPSTDPPSTDPPVDTPAVPPAPVEPAQGAAPAFEALPRTGGPSAELALSGMMLLLFGANAARHGRNQRTRPRPVAGAHLR